MKLLDCLRIRKNIKKIVCYSCCTGGYDNISLYDVVHPDYDYVFFTDDEDLIQKKHVGHWEIRPLVYNKSTKVKNARWHKVNAHVLFPEYKYSLWLDANIKIKNDNVYNKIQYFIDNNIKFSVPIHPDRTCIYEEGEIIKELKIDTVKNVNNQLAFLRKRKYPINNGLHETCILFREHNVLKKVLIEWWKMIYKYSKRDQLSFDYVTWNKKISIHPFYDNKEDHRTKGDFVFLYGKNHNQDVITSDLDENTKQNFIKKQNFINLFYKCEGNKVKYRFCGIPLFSIRNNDNKKIIRFLGIKFTYKKNVKVTKDVPDGEVWAGNPAHFITTIEDYTKKSVDLYNTEEQKLLRKFVMEKRSISSEKKLTS